MGKSLFEFSKDKKSVDDLIKGKAKNANIDEEDMKRKIKDYSKLSENDLMGELYKEVGKQKSKGNFDIGQLSQQFQSIKPMLNQKQSANLEKILKNLK